MVALLLVGLMRLSQAQPGSNGTDAELLLDFKASFVNGDAILANWTAGGGSPCGWPFVKCDSKGAVRELQLGRLELVGTVPPPSGWVLPPTLEVLSLFWNQVSGPILPGWELPESLQQVRCWWAVAVCVTRTVYPPQASHFLCTKGCSGC